jgi:GNAT superfamily N-acetyltransferase
MVIHKLTVDPAAQRQGVGSAFFRLAEELAKKQGVRSLRVDTYCLNDRMQALILKQGYHQVGNVHYPQRELPYPCYEKVLDAPSPICT